MNRKTVFVIVLLVGLYVICQAIADIGATKLVEVGGVIMPGGTFVFAITFTLRDLIHKRLGKDWARAAIICAGLFNVLQAFYLQGISRLPSPVFVENGEAWAAIFSIVPAITIGSILAEIASELTDTEIFHLIKTRWPRLPQWIRVLFSNAVSLPLDSLIFAMFAFVILPPLFGAEALPFVAAWGIVAGQIIWKGIVTVASLPMIYLVKDEPLL